MTSLSPAFSKTALSHISKPKDSMRQVLNTELRYHAQDGKDSLYTYKIKLLP